MNLHDTLIDIHALEMELLNFERKYGMLMSPTARMIVSIW